MIGPQEGAGSPVGSVKVSIPCDTIFSEVSANGRSIQIKARLSSVPDTWLIYVLNEGQWEQQPISFICPGRDVIRHLLRVTGLLYLGVFG